MTSALGLLRLPIQSVEWSQLLALRSDENSKKSLQYGWEATITKCGAFSILEIWATPVPGCPLNSSIQFTQVI